MTTDRVTLAEIRAGLKAVASGERPNMCRASPAVLEAWQGTRPDLTLQQFIELVVLAVGKAGRQREPRRRARGKR